MSKKKRERPDPASLGLARVGVESHAHLDMGEYEAGEIGPVLDRAAAAGVARVGNVFLGPAAFAAHRQYFDDRPEVFFLCGIHPCDAAKAAPGDLPALEAAFRAEPRLRAMGEIGLDYYWDQETKAVQRQVLGDQLALARSLDVPVAIHSREAEADTLSVLDDLGFRDRPLVWHCFGGGADLAREVLSRGWQVSIPGPVTYPKNTDLAAAVAAMDLGRVLLETDAPFLSPEPWRGKRNEPAYLAFTAARVAELTGRDVAAVWQATGDNARRFFGL
ncbi:TatD family hydrolase [Solidesulfovibrio carbinoliphilus]|uniref:TatD family hydrolase n=1 Tax=Solidesulfovibrio carbinoliphilus TaxID=345370 RepID=UPI0001C25BBA|nr:TatD family hydrolase [Solidesulfovibrio carbinoliphilus]